jgi:hypothetical protein
MHLHAETVRLEVANADRPVARLNAAFDDREAEADSSGFSSPRGFGAKKRVSEAMNQGFGNSGALVSNGQQHGRSALSGVNPERTGGSCMPDGVSEHVRDGTQQVPAVRLNAERLRHLQLQF